MKEHIWQNINIANALILKYIYQCLLYLLFFSLCKGKFMVFFHTVYFLFLEKKEKTYIYINCFTGIYLD